MYQAGESQLVLQRVGQVDVADAAFVLLDIGGHALVALAADAGGPLDRGAFADLRLPFGADLRQVVDEVEGGAGAVGAMDHGRSEEHTSELQSLMRISYDVFCLKKKTKNT